MTRIIGRADQAGSLSAVPRAWQGAGFELDDMEQARVRAAQILLNARMQARELITTAQALGVAERKAAWEHGYEAGMLQGQQEQAIIAQRLAALVASAALAHEESMRNLDHTIVALVLEVTRAVVRHEAATAPELILHVVRAALGELSAETAVTVRVHPADVVVLEAQTPALGLPATVQVSVIADPTVAAGGCLVESGAGRVDATVEKQLQRIRSLFDEHLCTS